MLGSDGVIVALQGPDSGDGRWRNLKKQNNVIVESLKRGTGTLSTIVSTSDGHLKLGDGHLGVKFGVRWPLERLVRAHRTNYCAVLYQQQVSIANKTPKLHLFQKSYNFL